MQVANAADLLGGRLRCQPTPVDQAVPCVRIDGEVPDLEGGQILEEVAALRGSQSKVSEARLHNRSRAGDLIPRHLDAEPRIVGTPAANADQQIRAVVLVELGIEKGDRLRDCLTAAAFEALGV